MPMPCPSCKTTLGLDLQFIIKNPMCVCPGCGVILDFTVNDEIKEELCIIDENDRVYCFDEYGNIENYPIIYLGRINNELLKDILEAQMKKRK